MKILKKIIFFNIISLLLISFNLKSLNVNKLTLNINFLVLNTLLFTVLNQIYTLKFNLLSLNFLKKFKDNIIIILNDSYFNLFILFIFVCFIQIYIMSFNRKILFSLVFIYTMCVFFYLDNPFLTLNFYTKNLIFFNINDKLVNYWLIIHPIFIHLNYGCCVVLIWLYVLKCNFFLNNYLIIKKMFKIIVYISIASTISMILGMFWASIESSWGGWWSWDIVEIILLILIIEVFIFIHKFLFNGGFVDNFIKNIGLIILIGFFLLRYDVSSSIHSFNTFNQLDELIPNIIIVVFIFYKNCKSLYFENNVFVNFLLSFLLSYKYLMIFILFLVTGSFYFKTQINSWLYINNLYLFILIIMMYLVFWFKMFNFNLFFNLIFFNLIFFNFFTFKEYLLISSINAALIGCFNFSILKNLHLIFLIIIYIFIVDDLTPLNISFKQLKLLDIKLFLINFNTNFNTLNVNYSINFIQNIKYFDLVTFEESFNINFMFSNSNLNANYYKMFENYFIKTWGLKKQWYILKNISLKEHYYLTTYLPLFLNIFWIFIFFLIKNFLIKSYKFKIRSII